MNNITLARKIRVDTAIRCDYDHMPIQKGKYATHVSGDEDTKAQGIYHGRQCYEAALADYNEKKERFDMQEAAND